MIKTNSKLKTTLKSLYGSFKDFVSAWLTGDAILASKAKFYQRLGFCFFSEKGNCTHLFEGHFLWWKKYRCEGCGYYAETKAKLEFSKCPFGYWDAVHIEFADSVISASDNYKFFLNIAVVSESGDVAIRGYYIMKSYVFNNKHISVKTYMKLERHFKNLGFDIAPEQFTVIYKD